MIYDCIIIGGGIAGLQAAVQLGRYMHKVLVIEKGEGRSTLCRSYHNILGYPDGISGNELRAIGKKQAEQCGVEFFQGEAISAEKKDDLFTITERCGEKFTSKMLLLATGVSERIPDFPALIPCLGISVYVCPDCDGYEVKGQRTIVFGSGKTGADMALTLTYWTDELLYINHEEKPLDQKQLESLKEHNIQYYQHPVTEILADDSQIKGFILRDGTELYAERAFISFGGNKVNSDLAKQLGVERLENNHIAVDPRTKLTNIQHVWAAGDVNAHSEQVTIAMGEGSQAAIWIHKNLLAGKKKE